MKYANQPLLQVCLVFVLGIWFGFTELSFDISFYVVIPSILFLLCLVTLILARSKVQFKILFSGIALLLVFSLGVLNTKMHFPKFQQSHFTQLQNRDSLHNTLVSFEGKITKSLKSNRFKDKYKLELDFLQGKRVNGSVLFQIQKKNESLIHPNLKISGYGKMKAFQDPTNPQQFNYKDYMASLQMSHSIDSDIHQIQLMELDEFDYIQFFEAAREYIKSSLADHDFTKAQMDIMQALLLGQKQNIDPKIYDQFSKAGVVHILAVSGLHVGILLLILQYITKALLRVKNGKVVRAIVVVLGIWCFAALAGFSTSVLRAAVMFSLLSIALNYRRKTSAINTLAISAVLLLSFNPYFIYQVGFQLSYFAVISIVTLQPRLSKLYTPTSYIHRKIWDILTVTIAAQIGVLPLSLYYFHQFPGLFLVSNLVILPVLGLLLAGGISVIILSLLEILPEFIAVTYAKLLDLLLVFVNWVSTKESLVFTDIYFTKPMLVISMILMLFIFFWNSKKKVLSYSFINIALLALMVSLYLEKQEQLQQRDVVVFHTYKTSQLGFLNGSALHLFSDRLQNEDSIYKSYHIRNYKTLKGIDTIILKEFDAVYDLGNSEFLLVLDSIPAYPKKGFKATYVLLKNSPDVNLERVWSDLKPKYIIADGSNYKTDVDRWKKSARKLNLKFHSTWEDGAFVISEDQFSKVPLKFD